MSTQEYRQGPEAELQDTFLLPPTVSDTENDVLNYNNLTGNPIVGVAPWLGINSESRIWLHCECTYADGSPGIIKLAEAVPAGTSTDTLAFTCELPLDELSKLGDNTSIIIILMVSTNGTLEKEYLTSVRYNLMFQHPITLTNYSRWMTDSGQDIEFLKLHELLLPSAHHSGVDKDGASWPADQWAVCQDHSFYHQMSNGIRVLDLTLVGKISDGLRRHIFEHAGYDAGRYLEECTTYVRDFLRENPFEIIILDFQKVLGNVIHDWLAREMGAFLGHQLIPYQAKDLTIGEIRRQFPGKNLIIAWGHGRGFWPKIEQRWNGEDFNSDESLAHYIKQTMVTPPKNRLWSMHAAGYDLLGPIRFGPNAAHWKEFFNATELHPYRRPTKGNIIHIDFFEKTGVVDRCINATRERGRAARISAPHNLKASSITSTSIRMVWSAPTDNEQPTSYKIFLNNKHISATTETYYLFDGLTPSTTYQLKITANYNSGEGAPAAVAAQTLEPPDAIPPTKPTHLRATHITDSTVTLEWTASSDNIGVSHYEILRGNTPINTTTNTRYTDRGLSLDSAYIFRVRAVDAAGNSSLSDPTTVRTSDKDMTPPSAPGNLRASTITNNSVTLEWTPSYDNVWVSGYEVRIGSTLLGTTLDTQYNVSGLTSNTHYTLSVVALDAAGNRSDSAVIWVTTAPESNAPTELKLFRQLSSGNYSWKPPINSGGVTGYQVSLDGEILRELNDTFITLFNLKPGVIHLFEVRARRNGVLSDPASISG